jgi:hypothetical protein
LAGRREGIAVRKWKLLLTLAMLVLSLTAATFVPWPGSQPLRITQENFARIHQGMSRAEVEAILGSPGDYRTGPTELVLVSGISDAVSTPAQMAHYFGKPNPVPELFDNGCTFGLWQCDGTVIWICYDKGGVSMSEFAPLARERRGAVTDFVWRLERMWRRWFP